jgi:hypothetical protein
MKRGVLAFTVAMTAAGVASALAPMPSALRPPQQAASGLQSAPSSTAKAALEARQPPVPLVMKRRSTIEPPAYDADAIGPVPAKATDAPGESAEGGAKAAIDAPGESAEGGGGAKAAIEADGYKGVKVLRKGADGLWHAEGLRGSTKVLLTVDAQGNVAAE